MFFIFGVGTFVVISLNNVPVKFFLTGECGMWSPREQHAVAVHGEYMYVSGGYASQLYSLNSNCGPYACGDSDAGANRYSEELLK